MRPPARATYDVLEIKRYVAGRGYRLQIDKTHQVRGPLWVVTDRAREYDEPFFAYMNAEFETNFGFAPNGSRTTLGRAGWFWVPGHEPGVWLGPGVLED